VLKVSISVIIMTTDIPNRKKYVVSSSKEQIVFPKVEINKDNKNNIEETICNFIRENYLLLSNNELMPQIVSLHQPMLCENEDELSVVYGCVVPKEAQYNPDKCFWTELELLDNENNEESYLLMNAIKNLL